MGGLLGFLITSAVLAIVGTAIRGLMRPLTLGLLALALSLFASAQLGEGSPNIIGNDPPPQAIEGLQDAAEDLEPVIDQAFPPEPTPTPTPTDAEITEEPSPSPLQIAPSPTPSPSPSPSPIQGFW
ncbi:hypothetical protein [Egbenema bharatensis]|uniref:hypothetical protein n=1 Tax=Egbenema bharatensis TaxID=3463334 RepID=UPI003A8BDC91